jgi:hypothetical protein
MIRLALPHACVDLPASQSRAIRAALPTDHSFINPLAAPAEGDIIDLLALALPNARWPSEMKHTRKPTVAIGGDDPGGPEGMGGPDAFRCTRQLSRWARSVIVHAAGGEPEHYAMAVQAVLKVGRVALIETTSMHAKAWAKRMNCPRTLLILPKDGPHPLPQKAEAVL